ncbi:2,5-diamino-6-(ribosylamino)-4(3H)-pyrimidinone 5'-phosphate reductase [Basidiobolus ranarum]|uniref:2,5-diamino-6-ribosylamino-4(3H)-pyrimidinone 5'-phosphate reductase n=1 Tax=Basidiobolus ranarum TaxID=34480 RepID=A0ABR2VVF8_9FUNG
MSGVQEARAFLSSIYQRSEENSYKKPYVTLTYAQSLDSKIAGPGGKQITLSGNESMAVTHRLRTINDGILIGVGTLLNDDPRLTARIVEPNEIPVQPQPIILDSKLRFPLKSNLILSASQGGGKFPWVFCAPDHSPQRRQALEAAGVQVFVVSNQGDKLSIPEVLRRIEELGIRKLMVEGGSNIIREFLVSGYVDLCIITVAPVNIGGAGVSSVADGDNRPMSKLSGVRYQQFGIDMVIAGYASATGVSGFNQGAQNYNSQHNFAPNTGYPPNQNSGYPPSQNSAYPPSQNSAYPPSQNSAYPPNQNSAYPPNQNSAYPPNQSSGYPPSQGSGHPPAGNYPPTSPTGSYPPTSPVSAYPPKPSGGYPSQGSQASGYPQRPQTGYPPDNLPLSSPGAGPQQGYPPATGMYPPPKTTSPVQSTPGRISSPTGSSPQHGSMYPPQGGSGYPPQGGSGYPPKPAQTGYPPQGSVYPPLNTTSPIHSPPMRVSSPPNAYPPPQGAGYPSQLNSGYPPKNNQGGYPSSQSPLYPPPNNAQPPSRTGTGYPPGSGYPSQNQSGYPPSGYPPNSGGSPSYPPPNNSPYPPQNATAPYPPPSK